MGEPNPLKPPAKEEFFNHWWRPGLLSQMVFAAHEREREVVPHPQRLIEVFTERNLPGFVQMTKYLASEPHLSCIGSSTASMNPGSGKDLDYKRFMELREFHLGIPRLRLKPMQHMHHLSCMLEYLPPEVLTLLDGVFEALSSVVEGEILDSFEEDFPQYSVEEILKKDS
jgi:hypothetical protein